MNTAYEEAVRFAVLGPVRAWRGDRELDLGSPQQRVVLTALLLRRGRPVTVGALVDAVWGEEPPAAALSVLRTYVSRLRKILEPGRDPAGPRAIVSVADGYLAHVTHGALDLGVFEQRVTEADRLRAAGQESEAADLLREALGAWQGTPLAGLPGPLAESERARLAEKRLTALEARLDLDVQLGRHREMIAELIALTGDHPLRERLCRLLMLALYRSGRQAEALEVYRRTRGTLMAELGIEPGTELRELHTLILAADASLTPSPAGKRSGPPANTPSDTPSPGMPSSGTPPAKAVDATSTAPGSRPAQLPADLPSFMGRNDELDQVRVLLSEDGSLPPTVVISAIGGMAGVGKTTLAVHWAHEVAHRFPDGQLYVNLRGFDPTGSVMPPEEAIHSFLGALGVPPQQIPAQLDAQAALYRSMLAHRRVLILLDNARDTDQVRPLLPGSPGSLVIVTSRNQLTGLIVNDGAHPLTLNPLTPAEAHGFLTRRLGAARLTAEPRAADEIIAHCARLPLALAIVAARATTNPGFPLSAIADELRDSHGSLDAFASDDLSTDARAVFSWSYEALSAPAARLFRLLGLHVGPDFSAPAAGALAGLPMRETRALLLELTRAHLLGEHLPGRYTLHDLLRVYAAERVRAEETPQERDRAVEQLLSWYLHTADAAIPLLIPHAVRQRLEPMPDSCLPLVFTTREQALDWFETERQNLVAAVHQAAASRRLSTTWQLSTALEGFFHLRSHLHDWLDTSRAGLSAARSARDREREAWLLSNVASALTSLGRSDEAFDHYQQAAALCQGLGETYGTARTLARLGKVYLETGQLEKAVEYSRRALAAFRVNGVALGEGVALTNLGDAYQRLSRFDDAIGCLEQALTVLRAIGGRWVEGVALDVLGTVNHRLRHHDDAIVRYHQALEAHRDVRNRWGEGSTLSNLGDALAAAGEPEAARAGWRQALALFEEFGHPDAEKIREKLRRLDERSPAHGDPASGRADSRDRTMTSGGTSARSPREPPVVHTPTKDSP